MISIFLKLSINVNCFLFSHYSIIIEDLLLLKGTTQGFIYINQHRRMHLKESRHAIVGTPSIGDHG